VAKPCPISRSDFVAKAEPVKVDVAGTQMTAEAKEFSTGSFGWYLTGKVTIVVDGKPLSVQVGANLTVVGSKEAPAQ
jgi:hypothetical protein